MAFCVECGTKLPEGARFCNNCGKAVAPVAPAVPVAGVTMPVAEEVSAPAADIASAPVTEEAVTAENIMEENVYANAAAEPAPAPVADVASEIAESQNVYAENSEAVTEDAESAYEAVCTDTEDTEPVTQEPDLAPVFVPDVFAETANTGFGASESTTRAEQQACLDSLYARLKNERLCWKIFGFVWIGYAVMFTLLAVASEMVLILYPLFLYLPCAIVSFIMAKKVNGYINTLYTDCSSAVERCGSVGTIVLGALFNTVAMIFIIINFVNVKSNKQTFEDIKRNQDAYNRNRVL